MPVELKRYGSLIVAAIFAISIEGMVQAEPSAVVRTTELMRSEEMELLKEEETVSIASRYEQPISQAPSNVYVITDEDIRYSGATDLPTVLRRIPGLEVMQMTGADYNLSVRGDNELLANKLLVLVDGRSIYVDAQGFSFLKTIPLTLPEIKRIEVLKGPASAVYGFNAFDGIINIITKSPEEMRGTTVQVGGGELGTLTSSAVQAGTMGKLGYRLSIGEDQNQQWRNHDALAFRAYKFNGQADYALSSLSRLSVSGGFFDANRFDGPIFRGATNLMSQITLPYAHVVYDRPNFFLRAFWNQFNAGSLLQTDPLLAGLQQTTDPTGNPNLAFLGNTYNVEGQQAVEVSAHRITYGMNYRYNTFSGNSVVGPSQESRLGFYLQDEWRARDAFTVVVGARYDLHSQINPTFSPRVALLYEIVPDHTLRATVSVAYRPPTLFETQENLQVTLFPLGLTAPIQGSTRLEPEQIVSYEIGYQGWYYRHRMRVRADMFFNHISNLIQTVGTITTGFTNENAQGADIYGGEAGVEFLFTRWLSAFANFSYQEISQPAGGNRGGPRFKGNGGIRGEWESGITAEALFHHYGSAVYPLGVSFDTFSSAVALPSPRVGSYNLLNMRAGYRFWQQKAAAGYMREAEVAVSVFNALNDEHKEHPLGDLISRRVMGWLTLKF